MVKQGRSTFGSLNGKSIVTVQAKERQASSGSKWIGATFLPCLCFPRAQLCASGLSTTCSTHQHKAACAARVSTQSPPALCFHHGSARLLALPPPPCRRRCVENIRIVDHHFSASSHIRYAAVLEECGGGGGVGHGQQHDGSGEKANFWPMPRTVLQGYP